MDIVTLFVCFRGNFSFDFTFTVFPTVLDEVLTHHKQHLPHACVTAFAIMTITPTQKKTALLIAYGQIGGGS